MFKLELNLCKYCESPVFGRIVFVLVLADETTTGKIVGFSLTTPLEFDLKPDKIETQFRQYYRTTN